MSDSAQAASAIRELGEKFVQFSLPQQTDEMIALVVQQQHLLEAYVRITPKERLDIGLIREVANKNSLLMQEATLAHVDAAAELDALAVGRSAVSAYEDPIPVNLAR